MKNITKWYRKVFFNVYKLFMKNRIVLFMTLSVLSVLAGGCSDWLDVTPQAQVNADKLFSDPKGFENALYGIYTSMTDPAEYGTHMTFGMMDVLAQYYRVHLTKDHDFYELSRFNFKNGNSQNTIHDMWLKTYNSIANCNVLLEYLQEKTPSFFPEGRYDMIYAEILALRAYLHFDLLRAFAPSWKQDADALCLPYADDFSEKIHPQRKTREIVELLLKDLEKSREILKTVDRARTDEFKDMGNHYVVNLDDVFATARAYRMNYWAVTGLMARIYHYMGDAQAYVFASEIIQAQRDGYFAFTRENELSAPLTGRDVVLKNEILFALNYPKIHDLWYSYENGKSGYTINEKAAIYPQGSDFRRLYMIIQNDKKADISVKYADVKSEKGGKIPMIRLSEMYLIAAESGFATNSPEAVGLLLELRKNRGVSGDISPTIKYEDFVQELTREARREFLGEGQMFYWYKRLGLPVDRGSGIVKLEPDQYCLPLPATEVEFGGRKEDYLSGL